MYIIFWVGRWPKKNRVVPSKTRILGLLLFQHFHGHIHLSREIDIHGFSMVFFLDFRFGFKLTKFKVQTNIDAEEELSVIVFELKDLQKLVINKYK